jgi:hypothetical protein
MHQVADDPSRPVPFLVTPADIAVMHPVAVGAVDTALAPLNVVPAKVTEPPWKAAGELRLRAAGRGDGRTGGRDGQRRSQAGRGGDQPEAG